MQYVVIAEVLTSLGIPVEADSPEAAIEEATTEGIQGLCHQCTGPYRGERPRWWREEGDEWREISVTDAEGKSLWRGHDLVTDFTLSHLQRLEGILRDENLSGAADRVKEYADNLSASSQV